VAPRYPVSAADIHIAPSRAGRPVRDVAGGAPRPGWHLHDRPAPRPVRPQRPQRDL